MTYSKEVTNKIVECWGLGFTAEETVKALEDWKGIQVGIATVYRHRHNLTAQQCIDELIRKQMRDIATNDDPNLKLKYRNELLKLLIPQRIESLNMTAQKVVHEIKWQQSQSNTSLNIPLTMDKINSTNQTSDSDS